MYYKILFIVLSVFLLPLGCKPSGTEMQANPTEQNQEKKAPVLALHEAVQTGNIASMKLLLEHGADVHAVNEQGFTPLELALQSNNERAVQFLLQNGAGNRDVNAQGKPLWIVYSATMTPSLMTTMFPSGASAEEVYEALSGAIAYNPNELTVDFLLEHAKSFPDFQTRCFWPAALVSQNQSMVDSLLIRNVLPLNGCPNMDEPPLVAAVRQDKDKLVASLLLLGANVTQRDKAGYTASYYALKKGNKELSDKLVAEEERIRAEEYAAVLARKKAAARKRAGKGECVIRKEDGTTVPCPRL